MTGFARSICPAPALATALLAALLLPGAVGAQERSRIEVVPQIPHYPKEIVHKGSERQGQYDENEYRDRFAARAGIRQVFAGYPVGAPH